MPDLFILFDCFYCIVVKLGQTDQRERDRLDRQICIVYISFLWHLSLIVVRCLMQSYSFWRRCHVFHRGKHMLSVSSRHDTYTDAVLVETWFLGQWCCICQGGLACLELLFNCLFCWIYMAGSPAVCSWQMYCLREPVWLSQAMVNHTVSRKSPSRAFLGTIHAMQLKAKGWWHMYMNMM